MMVWQVLVSVWMNRKEGHSVHAMRWHIEMLSLCQSETPVSLPLPTHKPFLPLQRTNPSVKSVIRSGQTDRQVDHSYHQSLFRSHIVPEISLPEPAGVLGTDRQCPLVHFESSWLLHGFGKLRLLIVCLCHFMTAYDTYCSKTTKSCLKLLADV